MAAFPSSIEPAPRSRVRVDRGVKTRISEGGAIRGRIQYAKALYFLDLIYEDLADAEVDLVVGAASSHFDAAPTSQHTVDVRGVTYDVHYLSQPEVIEYRGNLRTLRVQFAGYRQ